MSLRALQGPTGGGAPVGGSGTSSPSTIPRWTGASTLGDSIITQTGSTRITVGSGAYAGASVDGFRVANGTDSYIAASDGTRTLLMGANGAQVLIGSLTNHSLVVKTNNIDAMTILPGAAGVGGNVGINTASPLGKLNVENGTAFVGSSANTSQTNNLLNGYGYRIGSTLYGNVSIRSTYDNTTNAASLEFYTSPTGTTTTERARIDSTGNLLMAGNGTAANPIIANSTGVSGMYFPSAATVAIAANGAIAATFSKVAGAGVALGGTTGLVFDASGSQQGIKLRATPDSTDTQTLDCYAEGTWTPTLTGFGGTTPTATIARYTRVGRLVTVHVLLTATGGNQFSSTAATTLLTLPSGMTPAADAAGSTSNSVIGADGPCVAYTNGNLYVPTFALRTANTILTVTYSV